MARCVKLESGVTKLNVILLNFASINSTGVFICRNKIVYLCLHQEKLKISSRFDVDGNVPRTQTAFPRCIDTLSLCIRNSKARLSLVTFLMRVARSLKNSKASSPRAPKVSIAIGLKLYVRLMTSYFNRFLASAAVATTPGPVTAWLR